MYGTGDPVMLETATYRTGDPVMMALETLS